MIVIVEKGETLYRLDSPKCFWGFIGEKQYSYDDSERHLTVRYENFKGPQRNWERNYPKKQREEKEAEVKILSLVILSVFCINW